MIRDKIIQMVREAGVKTQQNKNCDVEYVFSVEQLEQLLSAESDKWMERTAILIRGEREACARVCGDLPTPDRISLDDESVYEGATLDCADAIRARSNT